MGPKKRSSSGHQSISAFFSTTAKLTRRDQCDKPDDNGSSTQDETHAVLRIRGN